MNKQSILDKKRKDRLNAAIQAKKESSSKPSKKKVEEVDLDEDEDSDDEEETPKKSSKKIPKKIVKTSSKPSKKKVEEEPEEDDDDIIIDDDDDIDTPPEDYDPEEDDSEESEDDDSEDSEDDDESEDDDSEESDDEESDDDDDSEESDDEESDDDDDEESEPPKKSKKTVKTPSKPEKKSKKAAKSEEDDSDSDEDEDEKPKKAVKKSAKPSKPEKKSKKAAKSEEDDDEDNNTKSKIEYIRFSKDKIYVSKKKNLDNGSMRPSGSPDAFINNFAENLSEKMSDIEGMENLSEAFNALKLGQKRAAASQIYAIAQESIMQTLIEDEKSVGFLNGSLIIRDVDGRIFKPAANTPMTTHVCKHAHQMVTFTGGEYALGYGFVYNKEGTSVSMLSVKCEEVGKNTYRILDDSSPFFKKGDIIDENGNVVKKPEKTSAPSKKAVKKKK